MQAYLDSKPIRRGLLFRTSTGKFLTCGMMCKLVKETLRFNNLSIDRYSTHSFHIGTATTAAAAGIPDSKIKILVWVHKCCYNIDWGLRPCNAQIVLVCDVDICR